VNYRDKKFNVKVELDDDGTYAIKGIRSTSFQLQSGNVFHIEEILYVPGLKKNLISIAVLESKGYTVAFSKGKCWHVYKKSVLVIDGKNSNNDDKQAGKEDQQTGRQGRRTTAIEWQDQQCKLRRRKTVKARQRFSEFRRSGNPKERGSNSRYTKSR
jgi:hypothetical protein